MEVQFSHAKAVAQRTAWKRRPDCSSNEFTTGSQCNDPCPIADELRDGYRMGVVVAVVAVMPIWLRKCAGRKERKQDKC
jgi:hypothetical protein